MPKSDRIQSVLVYIRQNLRNNLSIAELAAVAGLARVSSAAPFWLKPVSRPLRLLNSFAWRLRGS
jgi:hypothetical protein